MKPMDNVKGFRPGFFQKLAEKRGEAKLHRLSAEIQRLHAIVPMAEWQRKRITEIRNAGEFECKKLYQKARQLELGVLELYAQHEIDFIRASEGFREKNGRDAVWSPTVFGKVGVFFDSILKKLTAPGAEPEMAYGGEDQK